MRSTHVYRPGRASIRTVSQNGQIGVPVALRRALGWKPGDKISLVVRANTIEARLVRPTTPAP